MDEGFRGDSVLFQINDSVVFSRRVAADSLEVVVAVPDKENLLMVVRPEADAVSSFELPSEGGRVVLRNHDETVSMEAF